MSCKKYKPVRFPIEAYNNFVVKQRKMEETAKQLLGKPVTIPMTRILNISSMTPLKLPDNIIVKMVKKKRVIKVE